MPEPWWCEGRGSWLRHLWPWADGPRGQRRPRVSGHLFTAMPRPWRRSWQKQNSTASETCAVHRARSDTWRSIRGTKVYQSTVGDAGAYTYVSGVRCFIGFVQYMSSLGTARDYSPAEPNDMNAWWLCAFTILAAVLTKSELAAPSIDKYQNTSMLWTNRDQQSTWHLMCLMINWQQRTMLRLSVTQCGIMLYLFHNQYQENQSSESYDDKNIIEISGRPIYNQEEFAEVCVLEVVKQSISTKRKSNGHWIFGFLEAERIRMTRLVKSMKA